MKTIPESRPTQFNNADLPRKAVLISPYTPDRQTIKDLERNRPPGVQLVGYLQVEDGHDLSPESVPYLGAVEEIDSIIEDHKISDIYLNLSSPTYKNIHTLITQLVEKSYNVWLLDAVSGHASTQKSSAYPTIGQDNGNSIKPLTQTQRSVKRIFDLFLGSILQILALPIMGIVALVIKLDSPGPAVFKQLRVGENGRLFQIYKFRTMIPGAEEQLEDALPYDEDGNINHKTRDDPRVTRVGRFLRKTSLDELPQFLNVLNGDMSLVGPRPELPIIVAGYSLWQYDRFIVPQGLTGWWQVNGRSDKPMHLHTEDDIYYIRNYSFLLDLSIIIRTIWVMVRGIGAY